MDLVFLNVNLDGSDSFCNVNKFKKVILILYRTPNVEVVDAKPVDRNRSHQTKPFTPIGGFRSLLIKLYIPLREIRSHRIKLFIPLRGVRSHQIKPFIPYGGHTKPNLPYLLEEFDRTVHSFLSNSVTQNQISLSYWRNSAASNQTFHSYSLNWPISASMIRLKKCPCYRW